ncbi:DciA family protein [Acidithiobacillus sp. M4-SHS-6]|uniref:DciA family protein n=1 Tax=Acidithiobacillus sp. M4-SHS-6 TaxID=3383024 RepID=UPI0039BE6004
MNDKRQRAQRPFGCRQPGNIGSILQKARQLRERQAAWNALLGLEAQDCTWLVGWSENTLQVLCQSPVWHTWLRRHEKKLIKSWNKTFPDTPVQQIQSSVRPWQAQLPAPPQASKPAGKYAVQAAPILRESGKAMPPAIAAAMLRLAATLEKAQAGEATKVSAKEKGAEPSE